MTNKERDEILISLVKGLNSLQNTVNEMRTEMKNMATKEEIRKFATKEDLKKFATKEDLKKFATKEDLKKFATKEDLKKFATKEDLKKFATKEDLKKFATKEDLKKFATKEDLKKFATKDEMNARFDEQTALIRSEVVEAIKELSQISYERYIELKERIISNENEIKVIKLAIAN